MPKINAQPKQSSNLQAAIELARKGWKVFPLRAKDKIPLFPSPHPKGIKCSGECGKFGHGVLDATQDEEIITMWWTRHPNANIGGSCEGRVVFDFDAQHGAAFNENVFPLTAVNESGRGDGNIHVIYRVGGNAAESIRPGVNVLGAGIDIRAGSGSYIVLPPSIHPSGGKYRVINNIEEHVLTDDEVNIIWSAYFENPQQRRANLQVVSGGAGKLSDLLANPPIRGEGRTNEWLTKVAGHYAKMHRDKFDLYRQLVIDAISKVDPDYEDTDKVLNSIWDTENTQHPEREACDVNGYLVGTGVEIMAMGKNVEGELTLQPWADFDVKVIGVMVDEDNRRVYQVRLFARGRSIDTVVAPATLIDAKKRSAWLAQYGATITPRTSIYMPMDSGARLLRYMESQNAGEVKVVDYLGWDFETSQFVTFDGAIRKDGAVDIHQAGVVVDRSRLEQSKIRQSYGFEYTAEKAVEVLKQVQLFHFEELTRPFAAWWAACLLKPQTLEFTSIFPYFAFQAASGSAKTNGYIGMMVQLNGNYQGQMVPTTASFRDSATTNSSGIVWADDLDHPERLQEILRASASSGTVRKLGEDRKIQDARIVNPLLFTGESLGLDGQKALLERGFLFHVDKDVTKRVNAAGNPQWDDIVELQRQFNTERGLSVLAGWYVQMAINHQERYEKCLKEVRKGHGRHGDRYAVLRAGARLFDALVGVENAWEGKGETAIWVDSWVDDQMDILQGLENDNQLTLRVLPWALTTWGADNAPDKPVQPVDYRVSRLQAPPVLVKMPNDLEDTEDYELAMEVEVWVNVGRLAKAWEEAHSGKIDKRLETVESLTSQLSRVTYDRSTRLSKRVGGVLVQYRKLLPKYAAAVIKRAG